MKTFSISKTVLGGLLGGALMAGMLSGSVQAQTAEPQSLTDLLRTIEQAQKQESAEAQRRIAEFRRDRNRQRELLNQANADLRAEQRRSEELEKRFDDNDRLTDQLTAQYRERLGALNELFGVLQQYAGDLRGQLATSATNVEFPGRIDKIDQLIAKTAEGSTLPSINEISNLWVVMSQELVASGEVSAFNAGVSEGGNSTDKRVIRVGMFQTVADGDFLKYVLPEGSDEGFLEVLPTQPGGAVGATAGALSNAQPGTLVDFAIDPLRGQILELEGQKPNFEQRIAQGGTIGYIIIAIGIFAVIFTILKLIYLLIVGGKIRGQIKKTEPSEGNPLGRVLKTYHDNRDVDVETLELKMDEAILKETPKIEWGNTFVKIISVVAPLMGLFGTVTGMINTFQAITLYGTGDPKTMAGGISQALMTTVLGLCVAIPTVLLHSVLASRSKSLIHILEEQSAGIVAVHAERENQNARPA